MNALRNKVQMIGNIAYAPEIKTFESGKKLAKMVLATSETYKKRTIGKNVTETQFHQLIAWGKSADIAEKFLKKGNEIAIEGKLINRSYVDKEGITRYVTEIQVTEFLLLSSTTKNEQGK